MTDTFNIFRPKIKSPDTHRYQGFFNKPQTTMNRFETYLYETVIDFSENHPWYQSFKLKVEILPELIRRALILLFPKKLKSTILLLPYLNT
ncbi:MAG: hypothetical protein CME32_24375 [Gimesia sp.]|nr:hypothetical protein [Gimesia sp.]